MNAIATSPPQIETSTLDEILLDLAALIELSPYDRRITENRYRRLKSHVERPSSPLRPYLINDESLIYAQGSVATSTTVLSGDDDDRFDVDAIVEIDVPAHWTETDPLDQLYETLQGFPGVIEIVRRTRCVQLRFAFMHMDVTIMDRSKRIAGQRPGHIFHSPDRGPASRVDSNPWGFTDWFRGKVGTGQPLFEEKLNMARKAAHASRLTFLDEAEREIVAEAKQIPLPPAIPTRIDAQEVVALKLLKRYLNLRYAHSNLKRPPSIWLTKLTGDIGLDPNGLTSQLFTLSSALSSNLRQHLAQETVPREENPSYRRDKINDRWPRPWPEARIDMNALADYLDELTKALQEMVRATQAVILKKVDDLFGERFGREERQILKTRYDRRDANSGLFIQSGSGTIFSPAIVKSRVDVQSIPQHHFHPVRMPPRKD